MISIKIAIFKIKKEVNFQEANASSNQILIIQDQVNMTKLKIRKRNGKNQRQSFHSQKKEISLELRRNLGLILLDQSTTLLIISFILRKIKRIRDDKKAFFTLHVSEVDFNLIINFNKTITIFHQA